MADKVERVVRVLDHVLGQHERGASLSAVAESLDGPLSSTHDLLRSMVAAGLLQVDAQKLYRTGPAFMRLAVAAVEQVDVVAAARPHLRQLVQEIGHDVYLAIRIGDDVTYVERFAGLQRAGLDIRLGDPVPLHSSAVGKLFAALSPDLAERALSGDLVALTPRTITSPESLRRELQVIRDREFALSIEETITGIIGFAAPVLDRDQRLVAAVHVSAFKDNLMNSDMADITRAASECAGVVRAALTSQPLAEVTR